MKQNLNKELIWHPLSNITPIHIKSANGLYLYDIDNKKYADMIASWWVNIHGHCNSRIANIINRQVSTLDHTMFADTTHDPAIKLCNNLVKYTYPLDKFIFSDNGSTSVEIAIKLAYQYSKNIGLKPYFMTIDGDYHGDTVGGMSVSYSRKFHSGFEDICFDKIILPFLEEDSIEDTLKFVEDNTKPGAILIIEPCVQGASGMRIMKPSLVKLLCKRVEANGGLVIFDEVMTGFYRTGKLFAFQLIDFIPHFLCLSKGLTAGFIPMAITITRQYIYEKFSENKFMHSHSFSGNPIGCAIANESLIMLEDDPPIWLEECHKNGLEIIKGKVNNARNIGAISAFEVNNPNEISNILLEKGYFVRPIGNTIYFLPPYCITEKELISAYEVLYLLTR
jgi:adenosylmethionine---8-amino-7-oxononanoate aminotransferase